MWDLTLLLEKVQLHRVEEKKTKIKKKLDGEFDEKKEEPNFFETAPNIQGKTKGEVYFDDDVEQVSYYIYYKDIQTNRCS